MKHPLLISSIGFAGMTLLLAPSSLSAATHYVSLESTDPTPPFVSWATAATNIQDAVDAAVTNDVIVVTNGVYAGGVWIGLPLKLLSVNGPQFTVINGGHTASCIFLTDWASLTGFTLTNGRTLSAGGGVSGSSTNAFLTNCVIVGNSANTAPLARCEGGGAAFCTLYNCALVGNSARGGSVLAAEPGYASGVGGAAYGCTLYNCTLTGNSAEVGGGAYECTLYNCTLTGNSAITSPYSEAYGGYGGGAHGCTLNNCTLTGNSAWQGGGAASSTLNNCIVYFNSVYFDSDPNGSNYDPLSTLNYCCTRPQPTNGTGNIDADPLFMDYAGGNLRLQFASRCINAGSNLYAASTTDLEGDARISGGVVDIGAYEFALTPSLEVARLILLVNDSDLGAKNKQPLVATLAAAMASFDRGNLNSGAKQLTAFQHKVRAQVARIDAALANEMIAAAQEIIGAVDGR